MSQPNPHLPLLNIFHLRDSSVLTRQNATLSVNSYFRTVDRHRIWRQFLGCSKVWIQRSTIEFWPIRMLKEVMWLLVEVLAVVSSLVEWHWTVVKWQDWTWVWNDFFGSYQRRLPHPIGNLVWPLEPDENNLRYKCLFAVSFIILVTAAHTLHQHNHSTLTRYWSHQLNNVPKFHFKSNRINYYCVNELQSQSKLDSKINIYPRLFVFYMIIGVLENVVVILLYSH